MSKVLLINGSPHKEGCTFTALSEIAKTLEAQGVESEIYWVGKEPLRGCMGCGGCSKGNGCVFGKDDGVNYIRDRLDEFDAIVLGSPVHYAAASGQIKCFADRLWYCSGAKLMNKVGASIVSCRRGGASAAFDELNKYFTIAKMPLASSQYWNQVHGNTPEQVLQDEEGMQTMRTLALQIAWMVKCIEAGRKAGIEAPVYEPVIRTNFIKPQ
jgi:multimeric flavodoxin WrbA